ncbi:TPR end-of-group domain-containing protein [Marinobacterium stanieri]|uniref:Tetratricopeptide repeat-containing protein n=1 Tax=Marinobacterium stanieri TaxID=49186 RepID=A0A1N6PYC7_9GAMM|nr:tetratricopeptide repeat protein [Marinobacterium stanieri]SIQ09404.1 Tetratricopeptide repeat-containing protein [Marinobacterium stanieri]
MRCLTRVVILMLLVLPAALNAQEAPDSGAESVMDSGNQPSALVTEQDVRDHVETLKEPLYNPFIERYLVDEVKALRTDMERQRVEMIQQITDRELKVANSSISYATDTVTYFFYLIAAASSILLIVGWSSIREIRDRVQTIADEKVGRLVEEYEERLERVEKELLRKSRIIQENQHELEVTNAVQSLWVKATQETSWEQKIRLYDRILELRPDNAEALTYKADAALELNQHQWAISLCNQALTLDPDSGHAYFQLACAYADLGASRIALDYLKKAVTISDEYREQARQEQRLLSLSQEPDFMSVLTQQDAEEAGKEA